MSKALYSIHYNIRKTINYCLYQGYYRFKYPELKQYKYVCRALSYSSAAVEFMNAEQKDSIFSSSEHLDSDSIVFDVGGETGIWSKQIYSKYEPYLYIFEPNPKSVTIT